MNIRKMFAVFCLIGSLLVLSGCKKPNFGVRVDESLNVEIIAENAEKGFMGAAGTIEVSEGQKLTVESTLKDKNEVSLKFTAAPALDIDAKTDELIGMVTGDGAETALEIVIKGPGTEEYEIAPGTYSVQAEALTKSNGRIIIRTK